MIHSTAIISSDAEIHPSASVGPYSLIHGSAIIEANVQIGSHVVIEGRVHIGEGTQIHAHAALGGTPQDHAFDGHDSSGIVVGKESVIREFVTIHRATQPDSSTFVGDRAFLMVGAHVAHDCVLEAGVTLTNYTCLAGYSHVGEAAVISSHCGIHQHTRIGSLAMIGALSKITQDIPPFVMVADNPARIVGLNLIGLRRAGRSAEDVRWLKDAFHKLFVTNVESWEHRIQAIRELGSSNPDVATLVDFLNADSKRGILQKWVPDRRI
jgi:UDP-N-acetylglucosamine acyltransferase